MENNHTLPLIKNKNEILQNIKTLDGYLEKTNSPECEYAKGLIQRGKCFVVVSSPDGGYRFFPSRFMGYANNTMEKHEKMGEMRRITGKTTRDGKVTNPRITMFLGDLIENGHEQWSHFETEYKNFCRKLRIIPNSINRKFWPPVK
jgi:hypothetical protein